VPEHVLEEGRRRSVGARDIESRQPAQREKLSLAA
jgi:hypothetical protein